MSDLISRSKLYNEIAKKEELARKRVLDTPTHSPAYLRYVAQLNERTELKHEIADAPPVEAAPVVHGEWIPVPSSDTSTGKAYECSNCKKMRYGSFMPPFCQMCGADMRKKV